ncbi:MAG: hypothetical protein VR78_17820 [Hoeflea sp. BRH_c9]|nr:MAG: hypothetical protein VR78_17820 [Hoeflea sp. BRH_c9]
MVREYLQRLIFAAPQQVRWILPLLLGIYRQKGVNAEIRRLICWGIETCARRNDVGSLLWFLYAAIFLEIQLTSAVCGQCLGMSNEIVDLMMFHGRHAGLFSFRVTDLRQRYADSNFTSPAWLPLYEIGRRGWDSSAAFNKIGGADDIVGLYAHLNANDVQFYNTEQGSFRLDMFKNWNLSQEDFEQEEQGLPEYDNFDFEDHWGDYE